MEIGIRFIEFRKAVGLSQKALSKELNVSQSAISQIEKSKTSPASELLQNISKTFNINLNWLLTGEGNMYKNDLLGKFELIENIGVINMEVVGEISAGLPGECPEIIDPIGWLALTTEQLPGDPGNYIVLQVNGSSMEPNIRHSDYVIIKRDQNWEANIDKVCAIRINREITLKYLKECNGLFVLFPYNHHFEPIIINEFDEVLLIGSMFLLIRKY